VAPDSVTNPSIEPDDLFRRAHELNVPSTLSESVYRDLGIEGLVTVLDLALAGAKPYWIADGLAMFGIDRLRSLVRDTN